MTHSQGGIFSAEARCSEPYTHPFVVCVLLCRGVPACQDCKTYFGLLMTKLATMWALSLQGKTVLLSQSGNQRCPCCKLPHGCKHSFQQTASHVSTAESLLVCMQTLVNVCSNVLLTDTNPSMTDTIPSAPQCKKSTTWIP